jgi:hypothetical protein
LSSWDCLESQITLFQFSEMEAKCQEFTPVILVTWEAEIGRIKV